MDCAQKKREMTDDAALEIALRDHPEWRRAWERGELAHEIIGEDGQPKIQMPTPGWPPRGRN